MSRLDSVIRRLSAQRDCLNAVMGQLPQGPLLEIGLGNGRTYHHLRETAPEREVWVIDRAINAHPSSVPPESFYLEGDAERMIEALAAKIGPSIVMAHYDIGRGIGDLDVPLAESVARVLPQVLAPGALIVSNRELPGFELMPTPDSVAEGRYFIQRHNP